MASNPRKNSDFIDQLNAEFNTESSSEESATEKSAQLEKKEDFAALLNQSLQGSMRKLKVGDKIKGKILVIGGDEAFVSTGTQHDGALSRRELLDENGQLQFKQ